MKRKLSVLALAMAAGTASAQNSIVSDQPGTFVDISTLAGVNMLVTATPSDDTSYAFTSSVTNAVFASTNVRVATNGYMQFGAATGSATFTNGAIAAGTISPVAPTNAQALFPFWDDMNFPAGSTGNIYWIEGPAASFGLPASRGNVLIVQWKTGHYDFPTGATLSIAVGEASWEVQVYSNLVSNVAAQMLYQDVVFDDARFDNGATATVGFAAGSTGGAASLSNVQWSLDTAGAVTDGMVLSVLAPGGPTNPTVSGAADPVTAAPGDSVTFTAAAAGGINPNSTGLSVHGDLSMIGGSNNALFHDDGLNGDAVAGDHVFSFVYTIPGATSGGGYTLPLTVTDAQARSGNGTITGNIFNPTDLGTISADQTLSGTVPAAGGLFYRFTITQDMSAAASRYFDIDTNGSALNDTMLALYRTDGSIVTIDDDDGIGFKSVLSYGSGGGPAQGDAGTASTGVDGTLPAGTYILAVVQYFTTFGANFNNIYPAAGLGGDVTVNFTTGTPPPVTPPDSIDLGEIGAGDGNAEVVTTEDVSIDSTGQIVWYKFSVGQDILTGSTVYMDIDTEPSSDDGPQTIGSISDTEIGVYTPTGAMMGNDDDDGSNYHSQLSYGDNTNLRSAFGNGTPGNGRDGDMVAGTYYLAAGLFNVNFAGAFGVTGANTTTTGIFQVNFRTNVPGGGPAGPCSVADVGIAGGLAGHDHLLNNNDFIAFITLFFANDAQADMGVAGGVPGSDGQWNNNDFIAFISHFFNDVAGCNG